MRFARPLLLITVVALVVGACGGGASPTPAAGNVTATLKEWEMNLSPSSGTAGSVTFNITNNGEKTHEFVVVKTDLAADSLPVTADDEVDESAFEPVDEVEDILAGSTATLPVDLPAGHYAIICNLTGHYAKGMHADFTVQ